MGNRAISAILKNDIKMPRYYIEGDRKEHIEKSTRGSPNEEGVCRLVLKEKMEEWADWCIQKNKRKIRGTKQQQLESTIKEVKSRVEEINAYTKFLCCELPKKFPYEKFYESAKCEKQTKEGKCAKKIDKKGNVRLTWQDLDKVVSYAYDMIQNAEKDSGNMFSKIKDFLTEFLPQDEARKLNYCLNVREIHKYLFEPCYKLTYRQLFKGCFVELRYGDFIYVPEKHSQESKDMMLLEGQEEGHQSEDMSFERQEEGEAAFSNPVCMNGISNGQNLDLEGGEPEAEGAYHAQDLTKRIRYGARVITTCGKEGTVGRVVLDGPKKDLCYQVLLDGDNRSTCFRHVDLTVTIV